uniref:Uncharacterized protein n=1 Tax=Panthera leo TaxID=9689 RepID=A0A8C8XU21_PANLE
VRRVLRLLLGCFLTELCARGCPAQERAGHGQLAQLGCVVVLAGGGGNRSGAAWGGAGEGAGVSDQRPTRAPTPDFCRSYFDVMGQWDQPFTRETSSAAAGLVTSGSAACLRSGTEAQHLHQARHSAVAQHPQAPPPPPPRARTTPCTTPRRTRPPSSSAGWDVIVLVGIFKLGLEKAHGRQRQHVSRWNLGCLPATRTPPHFPLSPLLPVGGQGLCPALRPLQGLARTPRAGAPLLPPDSSTFLQLSLNFHYASPSGSELQQMGEGIWGLMERF